MHALHAETDREYRQSLLDVLPVGIARCRLLDIGCDDGSWTAKVAARLGCAPHDVSGIEVVEEARLQAVERRYDVRAADLEERWPFEDDSFDVVHANQVIEHVSRLDHFVSEVNRVLGRGGIAVICTENLASWHNVVALAAGYMPFSTANISRKGPVGNRWALHSGDEFEAKPESWQHQHVLTLDGLTSILALHGLETTERFAGGYYPTFGRLARALARRDPRHGHYIGVVARRRAA